MSLELIEDALGDPRNAQALAVASELAYLAEPEGKAAFGKQLGLEARLISAGNTQAYIATNDNHIVVAFRGTEAPTSLEGLKDWLLTDAGNLLITPQGDLGTDFQAAGVGARWHQGFMKALNDIWDPLFQAVEAERKHNDRPVWLTGHSLGGALALLAAWRFKRKFVPVHQIYTFGAPMVGNEEAAAAIDRDYPDKIYRYINFQDPIPGLPTVSLLANKYRHCRKEMLLGAQAAAEGTANSAAEFFQSLASRTVDGSPPAELIDTIWKGLQDRIGAHALANYHSHIAELLKKS